MSAYIVSDYHINALVSFAVRQRVSYYVEGAPFSARHVTISDENAESVGRILMDENVTSVNSRYQGRLDDEEKNAGASYRYKDLPRPHTAVEIIKACHCLDYQSCEHDGWESSIAFKILEAIRRAAEHALPGYNDAPWGLDEPTKAKA